MIDRPEFERIRAAALAGDPQGQESLAEILAAAGRAEDARQWLERAARSGEARILTRLGLWEIAGYGGPRDAARGLQRILDCGSAGFAEAAFG